MPRYCAPWPGNMKTTGVRSLVAAPTRPPFACKAAASSWLPPPRHDRTPMREGSPADLQRIGNVGQVGVRVLDHVLRKTLPLLRQCCFGPGRENDKLWTGGALGSRRGGLLENDMHIRPAHTERTDAS